MLKALRNLKDVVQGKAKLGQHRSSHWPTVRRLHLKRHPTCAVCGGSRHIEVHHVKPFHLFPEKELDPNNLVTLCEAKHDGVNCHLLFGHLGDFHSYNTDVILDADEWAHKIATRPA